MDIKKNDTYEYREVVKRPNLRVNLLEIGYCTEKVLFNELKEPFSGRLYFTTDTNKFYFDWKNKRHELDVYGDGGSGSSDMSIMEEIEKIKNGAGLDEDGTYTPDSTTNYLTEASSLKDADKKLDTKVKNIEDNLFEVTDLKYISDNTPTSIRTVVDDNNKLNLVIDTTDSVNQSNPLTTKTYVDSKSTLSPEQIEDIQEQVIDNIEDNLFEVTDLKYISDNTPTSIRTVVDDNNKLNLVIDTTDSVNQSNPLTTKTYVDSKTTDYSDLTNKPSINGTTLEGNVNLSTPEQLDAKQDTLVSGNNIKTINGESILGSGNITIQGGEGGGTVIDSLDSTSATSALSANQGRILNERTEVIESKFKRVIETQMRTTAVNGFITSEDKVVSEVSYSKGDVVPSSTYKYSTFDVEGAYSVRFEGVELKSNSNSTSGYAFYDENGDVILSSCKRFDVGTISTTELKEYIVLVPEGAVAFKTTSYLASTPLSTSAFYFYKTEIEDIEFEPKSDEIITIKPELEYGRLSYSTGQPTEYSSENGGSSYRYGNNQRTCNFIRCKKNSNITIKSSIPCYFYIHSYAADYSHMGRSGLISINSEYEYNVGAASFIKIVFSLDSDGGYDTLVPKFDLRITGKFNANWNVKNIRTTTGYSNLGVVVYPLVSTASDQETNGVQDNPVKSYDAGLLLLPESYSNEGKPTRLIIYCHGAGVNYQTSTSEFPSKDYKPEYWLSEGYAIMDMDGECGSSYTTQHNYAPESIQCYIAGYKQVIRDFNICTDGVFVGGRSMGGGMSISICNTNEIPVIACCPVAPVLNTLWWWQYASAERRIYLANKLGFTNIPETWENTDENWSYLKSQFDKLVKYSPLWKCISDLPNADTLFDGLRMSGSTHDITNEKVIAEYNVYKDLHVRLKCPVKIFHNYADPTVPWERNARIFYRMLLNAGNSCELRMFDTSNDVDTSVTAHHFEMRTDRLITYTNSYGVELQNVPVVYIEMLKFWQRYE